jgi:hypothetical protein
VLGVNLNSLAVVLNAGLKVFLFSVGQASVVIEVGLGPLHVDSFREAFNRLIVVAHSVQTDALVVISERIIWLHLNGERIVGDGSVELAQLVVCKASVEKSLEMTRVHLQRFGVKLNR